MLRFAVKLLLAGAALAAIWAFVPFGGRTLADRWDVARSPADFAERTWAEMKGEPPAPARSRPPPARTRSQAHGDQRSDDRSPARPAEGHTDADRRALDRLVADRL
jgi:hypothetical protein